MAFLVLLEALSPVERAARGVRVRLPGCGEDHRQDRDELPAHLRPRQAAHSPPEGRRATARHPRPGGRKARNSPAGSSRPPRAATWTRCSACSRPTWCRTGGGGKAQVIGKPLAGRQRVMRLLVGLRRRGRTLGASHRLAWVNGQPGAVMYDTEGRVVGVVELDVAEAWSRRSALWSIPTSLVISDRCLMWRDCRIRRNQIRRVTGRSRRIRYLGVLQSVSDLRSQWSSQASQRIRPTTN